MIAVIMLLLLFSILGMALLTTTMNSMKQSSGEVKSQSAYYIAESGVTLQLQKIEQVIADLSADTNIDEAVFFNELDKRIASPKSSAHQLVPERITSFELQQGEQPEAVVTTELVKVNTETGVREYRIVSKGTIGGRDRTVSKPVMVNYTQGEGFVMPRNLGVYAKSQMILTNGTVNGNIIMDTPSPRVLEISGNPTINGKVYIPVNSTGNVFKYSSGQQWWFDQKAPAVEKENLAQKIEMPAFPQPFPSYPMMADKSVSRDGNQHNLIKDGNINITHYLVADTTIKLDQNVRAKAITFNSNRKLTFDVGNKNISLVVDGISGSGHLDVVSQAGGSLTIYIRDNIGITGHLNKSRGKDLFLYIGPSTSAINPKTLVSTSYAEFNASLYAWDANIEIVGSAGFTGQLVTGGRSVKVSGGSSAQSDSTVVYAPNSTVELVEGGVMRGAIVSDIFKLSGGATVQSSEVDLGEGPFFQETGREREIFLDSGTTLEQ